MASVLAKYGHNLEERTKNQLGFPCNLDFEYGALLQFQSFAMNNLGDPFIDSGYGINSRQFEVGVLDWFARLWELEKNEYWGYVTNGGTEGNLHGILIGREIFPDGVLYTSKESHYSLFKAARLYRTDCVKVETLVSGEIDCSDFQAKLLPNKERPAIVNVNIGTTVKGAIDDLDLVIKILEESGFEDRFYIHCDRALFGLMLPFLKHESPIPRRCGGPPRARTTRMTEISPIGSMSISGHKFVGCPVPCGVQITRKSHINALSRDVKYLASRDTTILGSRNGHAPLFLWYALNRRDTVGSRRRGRLRAAGIGAMLNELSCTVVFERPQDEDFHLPLVVMPNVTVEKLCVFVDELVQRRCVWSRRGEIPSPCIAADVGRENCACLLHRHAQ
ncbi:unnamed protein product [Spirodela intermedia]|uniref:Uncharacterized protein n=1 Tax=Spirodela intermedia TaxID=51605 RepID=A0A7I8JQA9_SPIIN|nr:unnamed protein product [Spirodela intermedia]CAA6672347.1 unnamed protein product [Spirodela intermedia]